MFEAGSCLKNVFFKKRVCRDSHAVRLRQSAHGSVFGEEAVLQVNHRLADLFVFGQHVVVVEHHPQVLLQGEGAAELKHSEEHREREEKGFSTGPQSCDI